ncbi:M48 family metallopeptidase [Deinococcus xinjiangensis]|uniref:M48 family metallopeptidase n=1 Tax=Deinococcus xinjiangensis TaxID=457454 RepID=UPI0033658A42
MPGTVMPELKGGQRVAEYGTTRIPYTLKRSERRTLSIEVKSDGSVLAVAPLGAPEHEVRWKVEKRGAWILKQQRELAKLPPPLPERQYVSGESWRYLGRQHRLRVVIGPQEGVRVTRGELLVAVRSTDRTQKVLDAWLRNRTESILMERMQACLERAGHYGIHHSGEFQLRQMKTKWGSCTKTGKLAFNPSLVQAPKDCIDYVILHELCHLKEFSHSAAYYQLLGRVLPDWKRRRERLNRLVELPQ